MLHNTFLMTFASILQKCFAFVYFLFIARSFYPEQTGLFFLTLSFPVIFSVFTDFGLTSFVIRDVAKNGLNSFRQVRSILGIKVYLSIITFCVVFLGANIFHYSKEIQFYFLFGTTLMILESFQVYFYGIQRGLQMIKNEALGMIVGQIFIICFGVLSIYYFHSVLGIILSMFSGMFIHLLFSSIPLVRRFGVSIIKPIFPKCKNDLMPFFESYPFGISNIVTKISSNIDTIFISKLLDISVLGLYGVANKFAFTFQFIPLAFVASLYPRLSELSVLDQKKMEQTFVQSIKYLLIIVLPIVFGVRLIGDRIIDLTRPEYKESYKILSVYIFVLIPIFLDYPLGSFLNATHLQKEKMKNLMKAVVVNIFCNIIFIRWFGIMGCVYSAIITHTLVFLLDFRLVYSKLSTDFLYQQKHLFLCTIISALLMYLTGELLRSTLFWVMLIPICAMLYFGFLLLFRVLKIQELNSLFRGIFVKKEV